jgi:predicted nucleotidyltransferase
MNQMETELLAKLKSLLLRRLPLFKMILFGSRARGEAHPQADLDVVIIMDGEVTEQVADYISDCAWEAGFEHGIVVVPVIFSREEWEHGPERHSLLVQAVEAEGISL